LQLNKYLYVLNNPINFVDPFELVGKTQADQNDLARIIMSEMSIRNRNERVCVSWTAKNRAIRKNAIIIH